MATGEKAGDLMERGRRAVAADGGGRRLGGIGLGGIVIIVGIVLAFTWSVWVGLLLVLIGLVAFGGFVKGKWY
jgi:hypothetical protein